MSDPPCDPEVRLLLQCRGGSDRAARALWASHARSVRACARALTRDDHAAEDIVQRVFCSILETDRRSLGRVGDVRAYLVGAARNAAIGHIRSESRRSRREAMRGVERNEDGAPATGAAMEASDERLAPALAQALAALTDEHREILLVRAAGGLTFDQLALALGLNRSTAASRHRAAAANLRAMLDKDHNGRVPHSEAEAHYAR